MMYMKEVKRRYELKKRAENQDETRQRIVEAAVALHEGIGPAQTSISSIAERAGVSRPTVYRHFPDDRAVFDACTHHYLALHPPPDPSVWESIIDPIERLRAGLIEVYAWYAETEAMTANSRRDLPQLPVLAEVLAPQFANFNTAADILNAAFPDPEDRMLRAAIGHALAFSTWRSLLRDGGLSAVDTVAVMVGMVGSVAGVNTIPV
jgi:AcrR family transcriptional regulator